MSMPVRKIMTFIITGMTIRLFIGLTIKGDRWRLHVKRLSRIRILGQTNIHLRFGQAIIHHVSQLATHCLSLTILHPSNYLAVI